MKLILFTAAAAAILSASSSSAQEADVFRLMNEAVSSTPVTTIARAEMQRSQAASNQLLNGPYEYEVSGSAGYRRVEDPLLPDMGFTEWSIDLTRTFRLPEKRNLDASLADLETEIADARDASRRFEEELIFLSLWNEWARWTMLERVSREIADASSELAELEQAKVDAGTGRQIDADLLMAEASNFSLRAREDLSRAQMARNQLLQRYPSLNLPVAPPEIQISSSDITLILAARTDYDRMTRTASLEAQRAQTQALRANADLTPDPTFGIGLRSDFGGDETALVFSFSMPLSGQFRRSSAEQAGAQARLAEAQRSDLTWRLEQIVATARNTLQQSDVLLSGAIENETVIENALVRLEAGYELGDIRIDELINVRRRLIDASRSTAEQRAARQAAYLELLELTGEATP